MQLYPMDVPAEMHRRTEAYAQGLPPGDVVVARGPLIIMAHGLMALDPAERKGFWISSPVGDLGPAEAEQALREWQRSRAG